MKSFFKKALLIGLATWVFFPSSFLATKPKPEEKTDNMLPISFQPRGTSWGTLTWNEVLKAWVWQQAAPTPELVFESEKDWVEKMPSSTRKNTGPNLVNVGYSYKEGQGSSIWHDHLQTREHAGPEAIGTKNTPKQHIPFSLATVETGGFWSFLNGNWVYVEAAPEPDFYL